MQPHGSLNHLYRAFLLDFLWPVNLICLVLSPYLMCFRVLPYVCVHLLAKMDSSEEVMGMLASSTAFPHTCVVEKIFLTSRIRKYMAFYLFYSQGSALLLVFILSVCPQGTNSGCSIQCPSVFYLSPIMGREHRWISPVTVMKKVVHNWCFQFSYRTHIFLVDSIISIYLYLFI